jgi:peptide chain release factor subunit 1
VALVSSRHGRIFAGDEDGFEEVGDVEDDTHGQHRQGGWSYRRYANTVDEERRDHLDNVGRRLLDLLRRRPFDRLIVGGPDPVDQEFIGRLHPYLRERLAGTISLDVDSATAAAVGEAAVPVFEQHRHDHEREVIERLRAGIGRGPDGRAVGGLPEVLEALNEQRVEVLLLEPNLSGRGWVDPVTGYLAAEPGAAPTGGELQERENVVEAAIERAIEQSAEVLVLRDQPDLGPHGGVAALLRF